MSMLKVLVPDYSDGRTKQAFKDSTDINKILKKAQGGLGIAHALKYDAAVYGEFEDYDLLEAYGKLERANEIFDALPSEVRNEFNQDALKFAKYASDPENINRLNELIPAIARPGDFFETRLQPRELPPEAAPDPPGTPPLAAAVPAVEGVED